MINIPVIIERITGHKKNNLAHSFSDNVKIENAIDINSIVAVTDHSNTLKLNLVSSKNNLRFSSSTKKAKAVIFINENQAQKITTGNNLSCSNWIGCMYEATVKIKKQINSIILYIFFMCRRF